MFWCRFSALFFAKATATHNHAKPHACAFYLFFCPAITLNPPKLRPWIVSFVRFTKNSQKAKPLACNVNYHVAPHQSGKSSKGNGSGDESPVLRRVSRYFDCIRFPINCERQYSAINKASERLWSFFRFRGASGQNIRATSRLASLPGSRLKKERHTCGLTMWQG